MNTPRPKTPPMRAAYEPTPYTRPLDQTPPPPRPERPRQTPITSGTAPLRKRTVQLRWDSILTALATFVLGVAVGIGAWTMVQATTEHCYYGPGCAQSEPAPETPQGATEPVLVTDDQGNTWYMTEDGQALPWTR